MPTEADRSSADRNRLLALAEADLLRECRVDRLRGTGRGGQKRNVTESAVRVTHEASGLAACSDETRLQNRNRTVAVRLLRIEMALNWRQPPPDAWRWAQRPGPRNSVYALYLAELLDVLDACDYRVSDAAAFCGLSTGRLVRDLARDSHLWQAVNTVRQQRGMPVLRKP